jgi:folate-binding protein YgfZ
MSTTEIHENVTSAAEAADVRAQFSALISGCGIYELAQRAKIKLTGRDRERWLNGMVSNNIRDLTAGQGVYAFLLNPQGRILGDLYAYNRGEALLVETDRAQFEKVLSVFRKYIIMDQVEIEDISEKLSSIGIAGLHSREVLKAAGFQFPQLQALQFTDITWRQISVTLVRHDNPLVESYELWSAPGDIKTLREALANAGATPVGEPAVELLRIAAGIPRYGQDIRERDLPQETEQQRALNFTKGCYIGQEIVERIRSRGAVHRTFIGFEIEGSLPTPGAKVQVDGKDVGEITSVASLPTDGNERKVALGYCRREVGTPGREVMIGDAKARISPLPFAGITG